MSYVCVLCCGPEMKSVKCSHLVVNDEIRRALPSTVLTTFSGDGFWTTRANTTQVTDGRNALETEKRLKTDSIQLSIPRDWTYIFQCQTFNTKHSLKDFYYCLLPYQFRIHWTVLWNTSQEPERTLKKLRISSATRFDGDEGKKISNNIFLQGSEFRCSVSYRSCKQCGKEIM